LLARGRISRGYLGVGLQPVQLPADLVSKLALSQASGLMVVSVDTDGPAAKAGFFLGDILAALGEKPVEDTQHVQNALDAESVGKSLQAKLIRGGELKTIPITVGERQ
jgi:S1-C subfamily serine protease